MGVKKLNNITSFEGLNREKIEIRQVKSGSVKVFLPFGEQQIIVTRNQLVEKIEELSKKIESELNPDDFERFEGLKKKIVESEVTKAKGPLARFRRFFANLFKKNRLERLEKIEKYLSSIKSPSPPTVSLLPEVKKIESQEESSYSSMPEEDPIVLQAQACGLVKEEIEGLTSDQLKVVLSQLERSKEDEVRAYFGTDDSEILKKLFIQNAQKQKSKFEISGKIFKLRQDRIYAQKTEIAKGGYSVIYKIKELSLETFKVFEVARKTMNDKASVHEIENEYEKLKAVAELALQDQKCHLCDAFQAAPYRIVHKLKKDDRTQVAYLEGPLYGGDAYDAIVEIMDKSDQVLKAFDLIIQGIAFLQEKKIIHVDIKLENMFADILENEEIRFRLGDFGGVHYFADLKNGNVNLCHTHEFTPSDEIPSVNASLEALNQLSTFQLGNALFIAFKEGYLPGYKDGQYLKLEKVTSENVRDMLAGCKEIPEAAIDFIVALVNPKRVDRPTGNDLLLAWEKAKTAMPELFG